MTEPRHVLAEVGAGATVVGVLAAWLPPIAALFCIIWYAIAIWESRTVQTLKVKVSTWTRRP